MAQAILYCDRCGHIVSPGDQTRGTALVGNNVTVCAACAAKLTPEQRAAIIGPPPQEEARKTRRTTALPPRGGTASGRRGAGGTSSAAQSGGSHTLIVVVGSIAGILAGAAVAFVALKKPEPPPVRREIPIRRPHVDTTASPGPAVAPAPLPVPVGPPARAATARERLDQVKALRDEPLSRYLDIRSGVTYLKNDFPGTPEAEEAGRLLEEVDASYARRAEERLKAAEEKAAQLLAENGPGIAKAAVVAVRAEYGRGPWLEQRGERLIQEALGRLDEKILGVARDALARARALVEKNDLAAASAALEGRSDWPTAERAQAEELAADIARRQGRTAPAPPTPVAPVVPAPAAGPARGLLGEYFAGTGHDPVRIMMRRLDPTIDFDWGGGAPAEGLSPDWFSVLWRGEIEIPAAGKTEFQLTHDDAARLWVGDALVVDGETAGETAGTAELAAGWTGIKIQCVERHDLARCRLRWRSGGGEFAVVPAERLRAPQDLVAEARRDGERHTLPRGWVGSRRGASDGNPFVAGGEALWRVDAVWPDDFRKPDNYAPMTWDGKSWAGAANVDGDAPGAEEERGAFALRLAGPTQNSAGLKVPALVFVAPARGPYTIRAVVRVQMSRGNEAVKFHVMRLDRARGKTCEVAFAEIGDASARRLGEVTVGLDKGAEVAFVPRLAAGGQKARCIFEDLSIARNDVTTFVPAAAGAPGRPGARIPGDDGIPGQWAPGLVTEVFAGQGFATRTAVRIDPTVEGHYGWSPPDLGCPEDDFGIRWSGWLHVPTAGTYSFSADGHQHLRIMLDGECLGSTARQAAPIGTATLAAGLHPFVAELRETSGAAFARLSWKTPAGVEEVIPAQFFFHRVPGDGVGPPAKLVRGVAVEYFADAALAKSFAKGHLEEPRFDTGSLAPLGGLPADNFSMRISGHLLVLYPGDHKFGVQTTGTAQLEIDGKKVAEGTGAVEGRIALKSGFYPMKLEYAERSGTSALAVFWDPPDNQQGWSRLPAASCYCDAWEPPQVDRSGLAPGLAGELYVGTRPGARSVARFDATELLMEWNESPPNPAVPRDGFSAQWEGVLLVPQKGAYDFRVYHDGAVTVTLGARPLVTTRKEAKGWLQGTSNLTPGRTPIKISYANEAGEASLKVWWTGPGMAMRPIGADALGRPAASLPIVVPEGAERGTDAAGAGTPARTDAPPKEAPAAAGLVENAGFEDRGGGTVPAQGWTPANWGARGGYSVRSDRSNAHSGERAIVLRAMTDGALPGVFTSVRELRAGRYTLSFWACADDGATASVYGQLAGVEVGPAKVGDTYARISFPVDVVETRRAAELRLWTSTHDVQVWIDDVEVAPAP